ncbi:MAG: endonuclease MutS2, partial [Bacteroidetes bacterium]|nr:endonuclease MutS2 [Bacteroidota bacterium]
MGQEWVNKLSFNSDFQIIQLWLEQTADFKKILEERLPFPESNYFDAIPLLRVVEVPGTFLNPQDFHQLEKSLHTITQCIHFLSDKADNYPQLYKLAQRISLDEKIRKTIISKIDNNGDIRDNASPLLRKIRTNILQGKQNARKLLNQLLKKSVNDGIAPKEALLTVRAGRMVIPILTEHKKRIKGFIHDESSTGQTYFI